MTVAYTEGTMVVSNSVHTLAIFADGSLWAWGENNRGQLGNGTRANNPVKTRIGTYYDWVHVSAGGTHSLGIRIDGSLWAWGNNEYGQLGDNTMIDRHMYDLQKSPRRMLSDAGTFNLIKMNFWKFNTQKIIHQNPRHPYPASH